MMSQAQNICHFSEAFDHLFPLAFALLAGGLVLHDPELPAFLTRRNRQIPDCNRWVKWWTLTAKGGALRVRASRSNRGRHAPPHQGGLR